MVGFDVNLEVKSRQKQLYFVMYLVQTIKNTLISRYNLFSPESSFLSSTSTSESCVGRNVSEVPLDSCDTGLVESKHRFKESEKRLKLSNECIEYCEMEENHLAVLCVVEKND